VAVQWSNYVCRDAYVHEETKEWASDDTTSYIVFSCERNMNVVDYGVMENDECW
jgi:hypothetical protein